MLSPSPFYNQHAADGRRRPGCRKQSTLFTKCKHGAVRHFSDSKNQCGGTIGMTFILSGPWTRFTIGGARRHDPTAVRFSASLQDSRVEICLFSRFSVRIDGGIVDMHSAKAAELIAFLACERGCSVSKHRAADALWPDPGGDAAMQSLYKVIQHIRKLSYHGQKIPLTITRGAVNLDVARVTLDVLDFLRLYDSDEPKDWERAIGLYRDILLIDSGYDWASEYEADYDVRYYELLDRLEKHYVKTGNQNLARYYRKRLSE
jgi:two-component SAPR family response regulator